MNPQLKRVAIVLWAFAPVLLWMSTYRPEGTDKGRAIQVPLRLGGFERVDDYPMTESVIAMLGTPDAVWRRYASGTEDAFVVVVFHDENWKSVHAPDTCLRGSNMDIVDEGTISTRSLGGWDYEVGFLRMRALDTDRDYLSLYAFVAAPRFVTGHYWSFFFHHLPRALLRQSVSGCLLRVETWVDDGGLDAAESRCLGILTELVPACRDLLR